MSARIRTPGLRWWDGPQFCLTCGAPCIPDDTEDAPWCGEDFRHAVTWIPTSTVRPRYERWVIRCLKCGDVELTLQGDEGRIECPGCGALLGVANPSAVTRPAESAS